MQKAKLQLKFQRCFFSFWPIAWIFFVWFIFSYPYFVLHRVPFPSTYTVNFFPPWSAYHLYDGPIKNSAMPDIITQIYPWKVFTIDSLRHFQIPLWNPFSFSGTPHMANYQSAVFSPFNVLFFLFSFIDAWSLLILLQPLLAGAFTYLFAKSLKLSSLSSLFCAIAFMFCGFMTTWMDYGTLGYAILFLPLALFAIEKFSQTKKTIYCILLAVTIPLSFFSGHFQISLYFLAMIIVYILYIHVSKKDGKKSILLFVYVLFGLCLTMIQVLPSLEFYSQSLRSGLFQKIEAIPLGYLPTFLAPDFFGNPVTRNDWFGHYAEWNGYIGLLPWMLAIYGVWRKKTVYTTFLFITSVMILLLAFSTPVLSLLVALHIPVISTSAASRIIVLFSFLFIILSGFGLDIFMNDIRERSFRPIIIWLSSFIFVFVLLWTIVLFKLFLPIDKILIAKQNLTLPTIMFVAICIVCTLQLSYPTIITIVKQREKIKKKNNPLLFSNALIFSGIVLFIISFDMIRFATKWQPFDPKQFVFPNTQIMSNFPKKAMYERIYGDDGAQLSVYNYLSSIEGYDPLYVRAYGEFLSSLDGSLHEGSRSVVSFPKNEIYSSQALTLLDVKYIVQKDSDASQIWGFPFANYPTGQFTQVYNDGIYSVYRNAIPVNHVFFAQHYFVKTTPQSTITALFSPTTHLNNTIILDKDPHVSQGEVAGIAQITSYLPNTISITAKTNKDALLFISEVFYPGWKAYVDGHQTQIFKTDYTFRSVVVPAGFHTITFSYQPDSFLFGTMISVLGIVGIAGVSFLYRKKLIQ